MLQIDPTSPLVMVVGAAVAFLIGNALFRRDTAQEERRRKAIKIAGKLKELGLTRVPTVLEAYAVGDYSGIAGAVSDLHEVMLDPTQRRAEFYKVAKALITEFMRDEEQRPALLKHIQETRAANDPAFQEELKQKQAATPPADPVSPPANPPASAAAAKPAAA